MIDIYLDRTKKLMERWELCTEEVDRIDQLRERVENRQVIVSVIGQFKRGKSSMVNAMIDRQILPVGIVPVTSAVTRISKGRGDGVQVKVIYDSGLVQEVDADQLEEYLSVLKDPENEGGIDYVDVHCQSDFTDENIILVDTPGVGSFHRKNSEAAYDFIRESDGMLFMLSVDSPINQIEIDFLKSAKDFAGKFYFVVNKIDTISDKDLKSYVTYCENLLKTILEGKDVKIFPVSALTGEGIEELKTFIIEDCRNSIYEILKISTLRKLNKILESFLCRIKFYRRALNLPIGVLEKSIGQISKEIEDIRATEIEEARIVKDWTREIDGVDETEGNEFWAEKEETLRLRLNSVKQELSSLIEEKFQLGFGFEVDSIHRDDMRQIQWKDPGTRGVLLEEWFVGEVKKACDALETAVNKVFMYKEDSSVVVAYRIEDMYKLIGQLKRIHSDIAEEIKLADDEATVLKGEII